MASAGSRFRPPWQRDESLERIMSEACDPLAPAPEVLGRASEYFVKPFVGCLTFETLMPQQPDLDRCRGVGQLVGRDGVGLLESSCQWTRDDGRQFGIHEQGGQGKKMRQ
jgi:hypothetical protein